MGPTERLETTPERSKLMSKIRSRDTKPELLLKEHLEGISFKYQPASPGNPDFAAFGAPKTAVFVDGCYWHGCPWHYRPPKTNVEFWENKLLRNTTRDANVNRELVDGGWLVIRIWEHSLHKKNAAEIAAIVNLLRRAHTKKSLKVVRI